MTDEPDTPPPLEGEYMAPPGQAKPRPQLVQPPLNISLNLADVLPKSGLSRFFGLLGATAIGVTAAYFAPKIFDHLTGADDDDGEWVDIEGEDDSR